MRGKGQPRILLIEFLVLSAAVLLLPLVINDAYLLNKVDRYLIFAILSVSLSLSWGYAGILNLGQAASFGLGSYCMAMALKLAASPGLPDFMQWNNVKALPWFWLPFHSVTFAIFAGIALPVAVSFLVGWFVFRARVTGVYVAIITLAMLVVINLLIIGQQHYTGGFNGLTNLAEFVVLGVTFDPYSLATYYLVAVSLIAALLIGLFVIRSKAGLIMQAIRDDESRVRYFGYDVASYQNFAFCLSAAIAGFAGVLYTLVMEFASPTFLDVDISLSIVIWCAVGGRSSLVGAALGAILVTAVQGSLSNTPAFLSTWMLIMGAIFVIVVLALPNGLISLVDHAIMRLTGARLPRSNGRLSIASARTKKGMGGGAA
ncbi:MAG: urea ABC transporter permease subunit UrtC [Acetobacteraceae bacterium]